MNKTCGRAENSAPAVSNGEEIRMRFPKMQGIGNDFVVVDGFQFPELPDPAALSRAVCDRHFGVGADGLIWMVASDCADARMRIFNRDGSEPEMCGNGIRCAAKFLRDAGLAGEKMKIETLAGVLTIEMKGDDCTVDMGRPCMAPEKIPVAAADNRVTIDVGGRSLRFFCVSMGNPHAVIYCDDVDHLPLETIGPKFEFNPLFPERINTEFVQIINDHTVKMRVWERGSGETWACGTGACAVAVSSVLNGYCKQGEEITVQLRGGDLKITYEQDGTVLMKGPATKVFDGTIEYKEA